MDEELDRRFAAMMRRINDNHETVLARMDDMLARVSNLQTTSETTRNLIFNVPKVLIEALEQGFIQRIAQIEADVRKLKDRE